MAIDPAYVTLLTPVVGGAMTAMGLYLKERQVARNKTAERETAVADANAEVAFASEWWKASQLLGSEAPADAAERVAVFLSDAEALVAGTQHLAEARRTPVTFSRVLLLYPMHRRSARILKWCFFGGLFLLCSTAFGLASDMASSRSTDSQAVAGDVVMLISIMVLVLVLRMAATGLEHDAIPVSRPTGSDDAATVAGSPRAASGDRGDARPETHVDLRPLAGSEAAPATPSSSGTSA